MANEGGGSSTRQILAAILTALLRPAQISCRRPYPLLRIVLAAACLLARRLPPQSRRAAQRRGHLQRYPAGYHRARILG
jgi:hypothetical protein